LRAIAREKREKRLSTPTPRQGGEKAPPPCLRLSPAFPSLRSGNRPFGATAGESRMFVLVSCSCFAYARTRRPTRTSAWACLNIVVGCFRTRLFDFKIEPSFLLLPPAFAVPPPLSFRTLDKERRGDSVQLEEKQRKNNNETTLKQRLLKTSFHNPPRGGLCSFLS